MARYTILTFFTIFAFALHGVHASEIVFFNELPDVPIADGFTEEEHTSFTFNKAGGRVVEVVAEGPRAVTKDIVSFYTSSLPQFGWQPSDEFNYIRANEHLKMTIKHDDLKSYVHFIVMPK